MTENTINGKEIKTKIVDGQEINYYNIECLNVESGQVEIIEMQLPPLDDN